LDHPTPVHQQQKTAAALRSLVKTHIKDSSIAKNTFEEIETQISKLILNMSEAASKLHNEITEAQERNELRINPIDDSGDVYVMSQLQTSYNFQTRLENLQCTLEQAQNTFSSHTANNSPVKSTSALHASAPTSAYDSILADVPTEPMADATTSVWHEILREEVLPWLRTQLQGLPKQGSAYAVAATGGELPIGNALKPPVIIPRPGR